MEMKYGLAVALAAICVAGTASAADLGKRMPVKAPVVAAPVQTFAGFYVGAHLGYGWGAKDDDEADGFIGGGQLGYNWQIQNWVLGLEGQFSGSGISADQTMATVLGQISGSNDVNWLGSVTGKVGYAIGGNALLYAKGGFAFADYDYEASALGVTASAGKTRTGWTVGGGLEWMFAPAWSVMAEYQYYDFGSDTFDFNVLGVNVPVDIDSSIHTVKAGVNYHFGR
jgi:outer membrane immunogenic protein